VIEKHCGNVVYHALPRSYFTVIHCDVWVTVGFTRAARDHRIPHA
jgi:hypothetical protein